jgi:hypothetical protein
MSSSFFIICEKMKNGFGGSACSYSSAVSNAKERKRIQFFGRFQLDAFARVARLFGTTYQNGKNIPNGRKIYQMAVKYTKWP